MKRDDMISSLKSIFVPALRERGFKGSLPHFRRLMSERIDLLTIQFDRRGGGFVIEVSKCAPEGITMPWGKQIAPSRVTAWDVYPPHRPRLGAPQPGEGGHWFRFDDGTSTDRAATLAVSYLQEADEWWTQSEAWWKRVNG
jgi:hypothetical protein